MNSLNRKRDLRPLLLVMTVLSLLVLALCPGTWAGPNQDQLRQTVPSRTPSKPPSPTPTHVPSTPTPAPTLTPTSPATPTRTRRAQPKHTPTSDSSGHAQQPTPAQLPKTGAALPQPVLLGALLASMLGLLALVALRCSGPHGRRDC